MNMRHSHRWSKRASELCGGSVEENLSAVKLGKLLLGQSEASVHKPPAITSPRANIHDASKFQVCGRV